ncbi:lytic murein transglycosylase [Actinomadura bangladeshensis]|nr:lytic murein transglycosylase [Actinomadura bangladeshensis]
MQFLPTTWTAYGVDGDHDGRKDPYNHADWYVRKVLAQAARYAAPTATGRGAIAVKDCSGLTQYASC